MPRTLAIDYGYKKVGLAISDDVELTARPLQVIPNTDSLLKRIENICAEYGVRRIVLGLPVSDWHKQAEQAVMDFSRRLQEHLPLTIEYQDERDSTAYARAVLRLKGWDDARIRQSVDMYAALKILEDYLKKS